MHVVRIKESRNTKFPWWKELKKRDHLESLGTDGYIILKRDFTEITSEGVERIHVAQDMDKCRTPMNKEINLSVRKMREISCPTDEQLRSQEAS